MEAGPSSDDFDQETAALALNAARKVNEFLNAECKDLLMKLQNAESERDDLKQQLAANTRASFACLMVRSFTHQSFRREPNPPWL